MLIGAITISFSGVWVKLSSIEAEVSAFYRMFVGGVTITLILLFRGQGHLLKKFLTPAVAIAGVFFSLDLVFWHMSIGLIGPGLATILGNFQVFLVTAYSYFIYREKIKLSFLLAIPLAITGLFLIIRPDTGVLSAEYRWGIVFGFATAICYTCYLLQLKKSQTRNHPSAAFVVLGLISIICSILLAIGIWAKGGSFVIPDRVSLISMLSYGVFSQVVGWYLITKAISGISASMMGLMLLLQPALSFVWDMLIFDRPATLVTLIGVIMVLVAIYFGIASGQNLTKKKEHKNQRSAVST